jgi:hypothetical protein
VYCLKMLVLWKKMTFKLLKNVKHCKINSVAYSSQVSWVWLILFLFWTVVVIVYMYGKRSHTIIIKKTTRGSKLNRDYVTSGLCLIIGVRAEARRLLEWNEILWKGDSNFSSLL